MSLASNTKPVGFLPDETPTLGDRLLVNALNNKIKALDAYEENPTAETQSEFLAAVDHMNHIKENV